jgi:hypothetical protein
MSAIRVCSVDPFLLVTEEMASVDTSIQIHHRGVVFVHFNGLSLEGRGESQCHYSQLFHLDPLLQAFVLKDGAMLGRGNDGGVTIPLSVDGGLMSVW